MKLNCLIIDDEPLARTGLENYVKQTASLRYIASASDAAVAAELMQANPVDLLLVDIEMPGITGIDFVRSLAKPPMIIFVTAYSDYAVEGFELEVLDYLLKPVAYPRFLKSIDRAVSQFLAQSAHQQNDPFFFVKTNNRLERIRYADIHYIEARLNYVSIVTTGKKYIVYSSIKRMEESLPAGQFMKLHKSFIVAIDRIIAIEANQVCLEKIKLPVGKNQKQLVQELILKNRIV
jgi:DNA-binding LytR/AlgR family response regulator